MSKNKYKFIYIFFICLASIFLHSQDTIFIYEEVMEHDTIYLPKSFENSKIQKATLELNEKINAGNLIIKTDSVNIKIPINEINFGNSEDKNKLLTQKTTLSKNNERRKVNWHFGFLANAMYNNNSLFKEFDDGNTFAFGIGAFVELQIVKNFSLKLLPQYNFGISLNFDANSKDSALNGYYFANNIPYFFQGIAANNHIFMLPLQLHYSIDEWSPNLGVFAMYRTLKADFLTSSFTTNPPNFDVIKTLDTNYTQIGFSAGVEYKISKKINLGINYLFGSTPEINFKDDANSFVFNDSSIQDSFVSASIIYTIK